jgi:hypothetical protein
MSVGDPIPISSRRWHGRLETGVAGAMLGLLVALLVNRVSRKDPQ